MDQRRFLKQIERETPANLDLHLIVDNSAAHNPSTARVGLAKYERFHMHFRPTSTSFMIAAEHSYWPILQERVRGGSFTSVR